MPKRTPLVERAGEADETRGTTQVAPMKRFDNGDKVGELASAKAINETRGADGRFLPGNPGGPGSPLARRAVTMRRTLTDATTEADLLAIWRVLLDQAKGGDLPAIREVLNRLMGMPANSILLAKEEKPSDVDPMVVRITFDDEG